MQPFMLAAEVILLVVTFSFFLMTRRLVAEARKQANDPLQQNNLQPSPANVEMARDVAILLTELQSTAGAIRDEWAHQHADMKKTLFQVQSAETELRALLAQVDGAVISSVKPSVLASFSEPNVISSANGAKSHASFTMLEAITRFGDYLCAEGKSESTATRSMGYVRGFALWWGGHRYETITVDRFDSTGIENYFEYLRGQELRQNTIKRKMNTLRLFSTWLKQAQKEPANPKPETVVSGLPVRNKPETEKTPRQAVLDLAGQGLELRAIAAQVGMEQEAVRMILMVNAEV